MVEDTSNIKEHDSRFYNMDELVELLDLHNTAEFGTDQQSSRPVTTQH